MNGGQRYGAPRAPASTRRDGVGRRRFVQSGLWLAASTGSLAQSVLARVAPPAYSVDDVLAAITSPARASDRVRVELPERVEDGAVVPVTVTADLEDVRALYVLTDMNPMPIAAHFRLAAGVAPRIAVRIKLAGSGYVYGAAQRSDGLYWAAVATEVIAGGCS